MAEKFTPPPSEQIPEPGYYYHYKHDEGVGFKHHAYFICGAGIHTEDDCHPEDAFMQVYLPLDRDAYAFKIGGMFYLRPLHMIHEAPIVDGKEVSRFTRITDPALIEKLRAIKKDMYPWMDM